MFERIIAAKSEGERQEVIKDFAANCNGMEVRNHNGGEYCCYMLKNKFKINVYILLPTRNHNGVKCYYYQYNKILKM